jgi:signal transduction histidine kinase
MPAGGTIRIHTRVEDGDAVVAVADEGEGIPQDTVGRIFDPGFTTKGAGVGTGLGLSICHQIVSDHGGRIEVDSTPGQGTTFSVCLPMDLKESTAQ